MDDLFEDGLTRLEAGDSIDAIVRRMESRVAPEASAELRPLLETAAAARDFGSAGPSHAALQRGRTRLLVQAERLRREAPPRRFALNWSRLALRAMAIVAVVAVSLTSLVAASARTLPGDSLYGVKLAAEEVRLGASGETARTALEDALRTRRIDEIGELLRLRRPAQVVFEGVVTEIGDSTWEVGGLQIDVGAGTAFNGEIRPGMFVEVRGRTTDDGRLIAEAIYLRAYAFAGVLTARSGAIWQVGEVPVLITPETQLAPEIEVGDQVLVLAGVADDGTISARAVLLAQKALEDPGEEDNSGPGGGSDNSGPGSDSSGPGSGETEEPFETPQPDPEPDPEVEDETETEEPDESETDEPDETETDEPDETETDEPDETETEGSDDSGSGSDGSGSGSSGSGGGTETDEPDDD